jgi:hypothetical protein
VEKLGPSVGLDKEFHCIVFGDIVNELNVPLEFRTNCQQRSSPRVPLCHPLRGFTLVLQLSSLVIEPGLVVLRPRVNDCLFTQEPEGQGRLHPPEYLGLGVVELAKYNSSTNFGTDRMRTEGWSCK